MTEPVAYLVTSPSGEQQVMVEKPDFGYIEYLYTAEQLHPRVKMTQAEFDEWKFLYEDTVELSLTAYRVLNEILNSTHNISGKYVELSKRVYPENNVMLVSKKQAELTNLFINYNPDNPEETIEIVPDMKWFVRSKKVVKVVGENNYYAWLFDNDYLDVPEHMISDVIPPLAMIFDTKEEAEEWCNPLTEAVLLPVEVH